MKAFDFSIACAQMFCQFGDVETIPHEFYGIGFLIPLEEYDKQKKILLGLKIFKTNLMWL